MRVGREVERVQAVPLDFQVLGLARREGRDGRAVVGEGFEVGVFGALGRGGFVVGGGEAVGLGGAEEAGQLGGWGPFARLTFEWLLLHISIGRGRGRLPRGFDRGCRGDAGEVLGPDEPLHALFLGGLGVHWHTTDTLRTSVVLIRLLLLPLHVCAWIAVVAVADIGAERQCQPIVFSRRSIDFVVKCVKD